MNNNYSRIKRFFQLLIMRYGHKSSQPSVAVLAYHAFGEPILSLSETVFKRQMNYLFRKNIPVIRLEQIPNALSGNMGSAPLFAAITFDDCFQSAIDTALPVLKKYKFPATYFLTVKYADKILWGDADDLRWYSTNNGNRYPFQMYKKEDIEKLIAGGMDIGSHGMTHCNLDEQSKDIISKEVQESRHILKKWTGQSISSFCYPRGRYNQTTVQEVMNAGYMLGLSTIQSTCRPDFNPFITPRLYAMTSGIRFGFEVRGLYANLNKK